MKKEEIDALIGEYCTADPDGARKEEIREILAREGISEQECAGLTRLYQSLDRLTVPEPSAEMTASFYRRLSQVNKEKRSATDQVKRWLSFAEKVLFPKIGFALLFLCLGWLSGFWLTPSLRYEKSMSQTAGEVREMKEMVALNLLNQPLSTDRLRAVNLVQEWQDVNQEVASALLKTLNTDPTVNVRLVTVETLANFTDNPGVRQGLIRSISRQESPLVQLALAELMAGLSEQEALPQLNKLLAKKDLNYEVRDKIEDVVKIL